MHKADCALYRLPTILGGFDKGFTKHFGVQIGPQLAVRKRLGIIRDGRDGMSVRQTVQKPQQTDLYEVLPRQ